MTDLIEDCTLIKLFGFFYNHSPSFWLYNVELWLLERI